jgi:hypothetical protein
MPLKGVDAHRFVKRGGFQHILHRRLIGGGGVVSFTRRPVFLYRQEDS